MKKILINKNMKLKLLKALKNQLEKFIFQNLNNP